MNNCNKISLGNLDKKMNFVEMPNHLDFAPFPLIIFPNNSSTALSWSKLFMELAITMLEAVNMLLIVLSRPNLVELFFRYP